MATKTVHLKDFGKLLDEETKKRLIDQKQAIFNGLLRGMKDLTEKSPVDTGQYAASWDFTIDEKSAILGNYAPHAAVIERGARPFKPPLGPLLAWAKRVLQSPSQPPDYDSDVWGLAIGVQKKIMAEGMKPKNILESHLPQIIEYMTQELKK